MAEETSASGGGASSAYEVNDSDFEVSDVEGEMSARKVNQAERKDQEEDE